MANYSYVILVRHGHYQENGNLSEVAKEQCIQLAQRIIKVPYDKSANNVLLCSTAPRAIDSARVLQKEMNLVDPIFYEELWADRYHPYSRQKIEFLKNEILTFLEKNGSNRSLLLIVTHLEFTNIFLKDAGLFHKEFNCEYASGVVLCNNNVQTVETLIKESTIDCKLELLHKLLVANPKQLPGLPGILKAYENSYTDFCKATELCSSSTDKIYSQALRIFRDKLLENLL